MIHLAIKDQENLIENQEGQVENIANKMTKMISHKNLKNGHNYQKKNKQSKLESQCCKFMKPIKL